MQMIGANATATKAWYNTFSGRLHDW